MEIYVHIPFCERKCLYCDFASAPAAPGEPRAYTDALLAEIRLAGGGACKSPVSSIFIGGGTPSVIDPLYIEEILAALRSAFYVLPDAEVTMEANPGTLTAGKLAVYRRAGVNRLSLGLQSASDAELAVLGRIHTMAQFEESYRLARQAGFKNINIDLMSALPGQTMETLEHTLRAVCGLCPEHISVYSLIIEEGTPFYDLYHEADKARAAGIAQTAPLPNEDEEREMYRMTVQILAEQGYDRYEISNFAKPGYECRHNMGYWTGEYYLGFGAAAASYTGTQRYTNVRATRGYIARVREALSIKEESGEDQDPLRGLRAETVNVDRTAAMEEFMFLGLRLTEGVSAEKFLERFGTKITDEYGSVLAQVTEQGLMESGAGMYRLTERGIDLSNVVMSLFLH